MAMHKGNGGTVSVGADPGTSVPVGKWTLKKTVALANKTNSTSAGHKQRHATIADDQVTFELP